MLHFCVVSVEFGSAAKVHSSHFRHCLTIAHHASDRLFLMEQVPVIRSISPAASMERGQIVVVVTGQGFINLPTLMCRFGLATGNAIFISSKQIQCLTPAASRPGNVSLELTLNGVDYTAQGTNFEFLPMASLSAVDPRSGLLRGGMSVTVRGSGFAAIGKDGGYLITCRWDIPGPGPREVLVMRASIWNDSALGCVTPPVEEPGRALVFVFADEVNIVDENEPALTFEYEHEAITTVLVPTHGRSSGGTRITITGNGFIDSKDLICRFHTASAGKRPCSIAAIDCEVVVDVPGHFVSVTEVHCTTPALLELQIGKGDSSSGHALVEVVNHEWLSGSEHVNRGASFWYRPPPKVCPILQQCKYTVIQCFPLDFDA